MVWKGTIKGHWVDTKHQVGFFTLCMKSGAHRRKLINPNMSASCTKKGDEFSNMLDAASRLSDLNFHAVDYLVFYSRDLIFYMMFFNRQQKGFACSRSKNY